MWLLLFFVTLLLGYLTIAYWRSDFSKLEKAALSFSLGMGEISLLMFFLGLLNVPLTAEKVLTSSLALCFLLLIITIFKTGNPFKIKKVKIERPKVLEIILSLVVLFLVFWSFTQTIVWPPWEWDVLALYDFRAKVMAEEHSLATEFLTSQPNLTAYNYVYPFSTSLMHTLFYIGGASNPQFIYTLFYACLMLLLYGCLRRGVSRLQALTLTALLATTPEILFPSTIAYPNIPYALYFSFSTIYFWQWLKYKKTGFLVVSALFLAISSWIRNSEPFWIVNLLLVIFFLLREKKVLLTAFYLIIFLPLQQLWPIYQKHIFSLSKDIFFSPPEPFKFSLTKIPQALFFGTKFFFKDWLEYIFILLFSFFLLRKWKKGDRFVLVWLAGYFFLSLAGTYFFAISFPWWNQIGGSASRISVFFAPLLLYAISTTWTKTTFIKEYFDKISLFLTVERKKIKLLRWP